VGIIGKTDFCGRNHKFPLLGGDTSVINFTPQVGAGENVFIRKNRSLDFALKAVHLSNAGLGRSSFRSQRYSSIQRRVLVVKVNRVFVTKRTKLHAAVAQATVNVEFAYMKKGSMHNARTEPFFETITCRGRVNCRRCPCEPGSNPGNKPAGRRAVQKALL
jgi:hypothetical protein